jgi:hypothetical protein
VEFVEVELAWWHVVWDDEARKKFEAPWYARGWFRVRGWRSVEAGLANLEWQRNLRWKEDEGFEPGDENIGKLTPQATSAQEVLDLYTWWTVTRSARPDPYEASGWHAYCEACRVEKGSDSVMSMMSQSHSQELKEMGDKTHKLLQEIETAYETEDESMMIRLIKARGSLWT